MSMFVPVCVCACGHDVRPCFQRAETCPCLCPFACACAAMLSESRGVSVSVPVCVRPWRAAMLSESRDVSVSVPVCVCACGHGVRPCFQRAETCPCLCPFACACAAMACGHAIREQRRVRVCARLRVRVRPWRAAMLSESRDVSMSVPVCVCACGHGVRPCFQRAETCPCLCPFACARAAMACGHAFREQRRVHVCARLRVRVRPWRAAMLSESRDVSMFVPVLRVRVRPWRAAMLSESRDVSMFVPVCVCACGHGVRPYFQRAETCPCLCPFACVRAAMSPLCADLRLFGGKTLRTVLHQLLRLFSVGWGMVCDC